MQKLAWFAATLAFAACGDNASSPTPDSGVDAPDIDAPPDAPPTPFVPPAFTKLPLSATGTDQLLAAAPGPNNSFYAVGFRAPSFEGTSDRELALVRITSTGALDMAFGGGDGIATLNAQVGGGAELYRGIVVQSDGKIVVSGIVEDEVTAADRDIVVARFDADGVLDAGFGVAGVRRLDLSTAITVNNALVATDFTWGLAVDSTDRIYVHAAQRGAGLDANNQPRSDTDFAIVRLDANGTVDAGFGTAGTFALDIAFSQASGARGGARDLHVLADGSILASGYTETPGFAPTRQPIIYKVTSGGTLDTSFGTSGFFHELILQTDLECYGISIKADGKIVTAGYGRDAGDATANDFVSLRLAANGTLDTTWGTDGVLRFDPKSAAFQDNNRNLVGLPGGRTALLGSSGPSGTTSDAVFAILGADGSFDTDFGTGITTYEDGGAEQFWGGAVSADGTKALFVGYRGAGATPDAANNDDAAFVILPL